MKSERFLESVALRGADKEKLADKAAGRPELVAVLISGMVSERGSVRLGSARVLQLASERQPKTVYTHIDDVIPLLKSENRILKWAVIHIIGNLAQVDSGNRIARILGPYLQPIPGPDLVTAVNVIGGATKIALAKPRLTKRIVESILRVEGACYRTPECRNIALGHAIEALDILFDQTKSKSPITDLARRQLKNSRPSTRRKAESFLKRRGLLSAK